MTVITLGPMPIRACDLDDATESASRDAAALAQRDRLLAAVALTLHTVLGSDETSFGAALNATLGALGNACGIHRVKVILQRVSADSGEPTHFLDYEWWAPWLASQTSLGLTQFPHSLIPSWLEVLQSGGALWCLIDDVPIQVRAAFASVGVQSVGSVPIFAGERYLGWVAFDDCIVKRVWSDAEIDALTAAARTIGAAIHRHELQRAMVAERDSRIESERRRAEEAEKANRQLRRRDALLEAVAASAEDLLAAREPGACMDAILARLGSTSGAQRAALNRFDWTPDDRELLGWQEVVHEWAAPGEIRQMETPMRRFPMRRDEPDWGQFQTEFEATGRVVVNIAEQDDRYRCDQSALGVVWSLAVPFIVDGVIWGALGFDYATPFVGHDEAELAALQTVASSIADALIRQRLEARSLAVERTRADENARLVSLLEVVVRSSRALFDAGEFESALRRWMGDLGQAVHAQRATFYDIVAHPSAAQQTMRTLCEWVQDGVDNSVPVSFDAPFVIDPRGAEDAMAAVMAGQLVFSHLEDTHGPHRALMERQGNATVVVLPIVMGGSTWGCLSFDFFTRTELSSGVVAALTTGADTLAVIVKRNEAARRALEERDLRIELEQRSLDAERARAMALRTANDELIGSMARLVALQDLPAFMGQLLLALTRTCRARTGSLLAFDGVDGRLWMRHCVIDGELVDVLRDPRLELWRQPVPETAVAQWRRDLAGQVLAYHPVPASDEGSTWPQGLQWHRDMGHRLRLHFPLNIGGQWVGIAGLLMSADARSDDFQLQQAVVLAQQAAIAMQMERLARLVERSAVQTERERMAAEIHDNLAQSFTSIAMQSESLAGLLAGDEDKSRVLRLIERTAREGLAEARMSVLALMPTDGWPGSLDLSLAALAERSSIRGGIECRFVSTGMPCAMPGPVQESLLRIAQEATSNAMRHSGGTQVRISLEYVAHRLRLTVEDDGRGRGGVDSQQPHGGFGLSGMESRAAAIGGSLRLDTSALGGLAVHVDAPCQRVAGGSW